MGPKNKNFIFKCVSVQYIGPLPGLFYQDKISDFSVKKKEREKHQCNIDKLYRSVTDKERKRSMIKSYHMTVTKNVGESHKIKLTHSSDQDQIRLNKYQ